jgi:hypothetical protein
MHRTDVLQQLIVTVFPPSVTASAAAQQQQSTSADSKSTPSGSSLSTLPQPFALAEFFYPNVALSASAPASSSPAASAGSPTIAMRLELIRLICMYWQFPFNEDWRRRWLSLTRPEQMVTAVSSGMHVVVCCLLADERT